jgi:geranylgeranyl diphosphate synthase type I
MDNGDIARPATEDAVNSRPAEEAVVDWSRTLARHEVSEFVRVQCARHFDDHPLSGCVVDLLLDFARRGKYSRSVFGYLGWLCGCEEDPAALRAAASLELLHVFALLQDDVMDGSKTRRGKPTAHLRLAARHRELGLPGSSVRFGESAAVLLSDLCLVWAEQMLRESGLGGTRLERALPRYDDLRSELAVGQFGDLLNDIRADPDFAAVLDLARRKSGNYTVRRPLELGAALAGCDAQTMAALGRYGTLIGEAFQLRDDLLGVFGEPAVTGKPADDDLRERKATSVVVLAEELANATQRPRLAESAAGAESSPAAIEQWRQLISATGAPGRIEELISSRVHAADRVIAAARIPTRPKQLLTDLARKCAERDA